MWRFLLGPFLAILPKRWRKSLAFSDAVNWRAASILSGMAESIAALVALMYWYSYSVTTWVSRGLDAAIAGKAPPGTTDHEIGFVALLIWATSPITWGLCYVGVEGMVRLCAAFTDTVLGVFPLFILDKLYVKIFLGGEPKPPGTPQFSQSHVASYVGTVREKVLTARLPLVPDELCIAKSETEEILEIRACRAKEDWTPPRVVRIDDNYYRLEASSKKSGSRPFVYTLRRLAAGVPGRSVIIYSPTETPVIAAR
jgi:hypothetical protein